MIAWVFSYQHLRQHLARKTRAHQPSEALQLAMLCGVASAHTAPTRVQARIASGPSASLTCVQQEQCSVEAIRFPCSPTDHFMPQRNLEHVLLHEPDSNPVRQATRSLHRNSSNVATPFTTCARTACCASCPAQTVSCKLPTTPEHARHRTSCHRTLLRVLLDKPKLPPHNLLCKLNSAPASQPQLPSLNAEKGASCTRKHGLRPTVLSSCNTLCAKRSRCLNVGAAN